VSGQKKAVWVERGPDHFAQADSYADIALRRSTLGLVRGAVLGWAGQGSGDGHYIKNRVCLADRPGRTSAHLHYDIHEKASVVNSYISSRVSFGEGARRSPGP
jgi:hypothetical protein